MQCVRRMRSTIKHTWYVMDFPPPVAMTKSASWPERTACVQQHHAKTSGDDFLQLRTVLIL